MVLAPWTVATPPFAVWIWTFKCRTGSVISDKSWLIVSVGRNKGSIVVFYLGWVGCFYKATRWNERPSGFHNSTPYLFVPPPLCPSPYFQLYCLLGRGWSNRSPWFLRHHLCHCLHSHHHHFFSLCPLGCKHFGYLMIFETLLLGVFIHLTMNAIKFWFFALWWRIPLLSRGLRAVVSQTHTCALGFILVVSSNPISPCVFNEGRGPCFTMSSDPFVSISNVC